MIKLTFTERYQQARTYAAQVRVRRQMGDRYAHYEHTPKIHTNSMRIEHYEPIPYALVAVR